jgi:germination protein M
VTKRLMKGPDESKHSRIINKGTKLLGIKIDDENNVVINFTSEYLTGDDTRDVQTTYAVVKSLCTLQMVHSVKVIVEGADIPTADGGTIGYLTAADINLPTDTYTTEMREIRLYFADKTTGMLTVEPRIIKVTDQQPIEQYIIGELIKGPQDSALSKVLDSDTTLISVDTEDNICFVNFSYDFIKKNSGGEQKEELAVYSIVNSLTEISGIGSVQFLIDGKKLTDFGNTDIYNVFERNEGIIER